MIGQTVPRAPCLAMLAVLPGVLAACGGAGTRTATQTVASHDPVSTGVVTHKPLHGTGGKESNDDNPESSTENRSSGQSEGPCALVSRADAQSVMGTPIATPQEAPLGPTCIYQPLHGKQSVTLAVEATAFQTIRPHIRKSTNFQVRGRTAYCGFYGQQTTFVPLSAGRVLAVAAPCSTGKLFVIKALARLKL